MQSGEAVKIAVRPENVRLGGNGKARAQYLHGPRRRPPLSGHADRLRTERAGWPLDALELGTQVRYPVGSDIKVVLPPDLCWAYPARETIDTE